MNEARLFHPQYQFGSNSENEFNRFYLGDNLVVLRELCQDSKIKGNVKLIYIDPPYSTGQDFVGYNYENAYSDKFHTDEEFLDFLEKRLVLLHELLSFDGSIYLHIDTKIGHYVKIRMDKIFGKENFRNEITRIKCNPKNFFRKAYGNIKDVIFFYSKTKPNGNDPMKWNDYRRPLTEHEILKQFPRIDKNGRRYATTPLHAKGETVNGPTGRFWKELKPPTGRHWRCPPEELTRLDEAGLIEWSATGNPRKMIYADQNPGKKIQDVWEFKDKGFEYSVYPTEKNQEMLNQIILQSSREGDLVLDCFAGSGTTLVAAEKYGRRWIGVDNSRVALYATVKKLFSNNVSSCFHVYYPSHEVSQVSCDLEITFRCNKRVEPATHLFEKEKNRLEIHVVELKNKSSDKRKDMGFVCSAVKENDSYHIQPLSFDHQNACYSLPIRTDFDQKDIFLVVFDLHGNEFLYQLDLKNDVANACNARTVNKCSISLPLTNTGSELSS